MLNTDLSKEQRKKKILLKYIDVYGYVIRNGFNDYEILDKIKID